MHKRSQFFGQLYLRLSLNKNFARFSSRGKTGKFLPKKQATHSLCAISLWKFDERNSYGAIQQGFKSANSKNN